jgi:hypothetical protein
MFEANDADTAFCACEALKAYEALVDVLALVANDELIAVVANDAEVATLALLAFTTLLAVILNVEPSPLVNVVVALLIDAVVSNEPVLTVTAEPVFTTIGNVEPSPLVNVIVFELTEAVNTLFKDNDAVIAFCACEALNAYEALIAVLASDAVTVSKLVLGL